MVKRRGGRRRCDGQRYKYPLGVGWADIAPGCQIESEPVQRERLCTTAPSGRAGFLSSSENPAALSNTLVTAGRGDRANDFR